MPTLQVRRTEHTASTAQRRRYEARIDERERASWRRANLRSNRSSLSARSREIRYASSASVLSQSRCTSTTRKLSASATRRVGLLPHQGRVLLLGSFQHILLGASSTTAAQPGRERRQGKAHASRVVTLLLLDSQHLSRQSLPAQHQTRPYAQDESCVCSPFPPGRCRRADPSARPSSLNSRATAPRRRQAAPPAPPAASEHSLLPATTTRESLQLTLAPPRLAAPPLPPRARRRHPAQGGARLEQEQGRRQGAPAAAQGPQQARQGGASAFLPSRRLVEREDGRPRRCAS